MGLRNFEVTRERNMVQNRVPIQRVPKLRIHSSVVRLTASLCSQAIECRVSTLLASIISFTWIVQKSIYCPPRCYTATQYDINKVGGNAIGLSITRQVNLNNGVRCNSRGLLRWMGRAIACWYSRVFWPYYYEPTVGEYRSLWPRSWNEVSSANDVDSALLTTCLNIIIYDAIMIWMDASVTYHARWRQEILQSRQIYLVKLMANFPDFNQDSSFETSLQRL